MEESSFSSSSSYSSALSSSSFSSSSSSSSSPSSSSSCSSLSSSSSSSPSSSREFVFPDFYHLPPFFTLQPNLTTRRQQLELWLRLLLDFCTFENNFIIDISNHSLSSPPFTNPKINRRLSLETLHLICSTLVDEHKAIWISSSSRASSSSSVEDGRGRRILVLWKNAAEWADCVYDWAKRNGKLNVVETIFALRSGDETKEEDFHEAPYELLMLALRELEKRGKAKIIRGGGEEGEGEKETYDYDVIGVKFFM